MTKCIIATKELEVKIGGVEYDCLLIPKNKYMDIDFTEHPEDHPKVRKLIEKVRNGEI